MFSELFGLIVILIYSLGLAFTAKMVTPKPAANSDWFFQKVFGDGEFIAAGQLRIPPKGRKPSKGTKDNTYVRFFLDPLFDLFFGRLPFL